MGDPRDPGRPGAPADRSRAGTAAGAAPASRTEAGPEPAPTVLDAAERGTRAAPQPGPATEGELVASTPDPDSSAPADARDDAPGGLLGLLLWPLRAAITLALRVFAAFVRGVLGALFPALRDERRQDRDPPR